MGSDVVTLALRDFTRHVVHIYSNAATVFQHLTSQWARMRAVEAEASGALAWCTLPLRCSQRCACVMLQRPRVALGLKVA